MSGNGVVAVLSVLIVLGSACGTGVIDHADQIAASTVEPSATTVAAPAASTSTTAPPPADTTSPAVPTEDADFRQATWDDPHVVIYGNYATDRSSAIRYLAASSDDVTELVDDTRRVLGFDLPFGVKVENGQIDISNGPNFPAPGVMWPVECLGVAPDVDGDGLLDDCDPYPGDGPLADWDNDGVVNPRDNCPTVSNPDQDVIFDRSSGAACDVREGVGPEVWVVVPTITLDEWNVVRTERGLDPLVMPTVPSPLPPEVAAWCASMSDDTDTDTFEAVERIPDAYGLTLDQRGELAVMVTQQSDLLAAYLQLQETAPEDLVTAAGSIDEVAAEFSAIEQELQALRGAMAPYLAPLLDSDIACNIDR